MSNNAILNINANVTIEGNLSMTDNSELFVRSGDTLTVNNAVFMFNSEITIEKNAVFIINGKFDTHKDVIITLNGNIYVYGDASLKHNTDIDGSGSFEITGKIQYNQNASLFGGQPKCNNGPCRFGPGQGLPIVLKTFTAELNSNAAIVSWTTATENNNNYFILEHSVNGAPFKVVAKIDGAGNSNKELNYKKEVVLNESGTHYFQLTQVDYDGKSENFPVINLRNDRSTAISNEKLTVYPNPLNGEIISLDIEGLDAGVYNIYLANGYGNLIIQNELRVGKEGSLRVENILEGQQLPKGIYYMTIYNQEIKLSKKIVVQ